MKGLFIKQEYYNPHRAKMFLCLVLFVAVGLPWGRTQLVNDGATNVVDGVVNNLTGDLTVGTNGDNALLVSNGGIVRCSTMVISDQDGYPESTSQACPALHRPFAGRWWGLLALLSVCLALFTTPASLFAQGASDSTGPDQSAPALSTDHPDYAPGTSAVVTGTGFAAGETITRRRDLTTPTRATPNTP